MFKSKGFTLVEVLLVVIIIGILAAVVIPRITYSTATANAAACKANIAALNSQLELYHVQKDGAYAGEISELIPEYIDAEPQCPVLKTVYTLTGNHRINTTGHGH